MGEVWLADDTRLPRQVALKTVRAADVVDTEGRNRLLREARAAATLTHPGIATVYDVLEADGQVVIVFEFVEGESLHARLKRGPLPLEEALDIAIQLGEALESAHGRGVVHRDLKPGNIIVGPDGRVKVLDFGVARMLPSATTTTRGGTRESLGGLVGTAGYAAPEQWVSPQVDARADLFALGVVLFEMVAGRRPFPTDDPIALAEVLFSREPPRLRAVAASVPSSLDDLVARLLDRDRERRPWSARAVLDELRRIAKRLQPAPPPPIWSKVLMAVTALLLVLVIGLVGWLFVQPRRPADAGAPPVVAVLPLANLSGDASKEYVAAGVADSLITSLVTLPSIVVLSRAAVAETRARAPDIDALAKELGAIFLVEGSVQQAGERLRISLTLVRARDRSVAWADSFEGRFSQIFDLQERLAVAVTRALSVHVAALGAARPAGSPTTSAQALDAYWRARGLLERRDVAGNLEAAVAALTTATRLDPDFALAHATLAEARWRQYSETRDSALMPLVVDSSTTALRLAADKPEVRYTLALVLAATGRIDEAEDELRRALAIRPNYDDARSQLGQLLASQGRLDEAKIEFTRAIALRPGYWGHYNDLGLVLFRAARYREAAETFEQLTRVQPDNYYGYQQLGSTYQMLGEDDRALAYYERSIAIRPSLGALSNIGTIHYRRGEYHRAVEAYEKAVELRPNVPAAHRNLGDALGRTGRHAEAQAAYRTAVELAEAQLAVNPNNAVMTASLAVYLAKAGSPDAALASIDRAIGLAPDDVQVSYRAGVVHALGGRSDLAVAALRKALDGGYSRSEIAADEDLASLRGRPDFRALLSTDQTKGDPP
jgi:tetratricopeptide (TPR) repeat protein